MSKINNSGLDQYCAELIEQQQFGTAGIEGVKIMTLKQQTCPYATLTMIPMHFHTTMCY